MSNLKAPIIVGIIGFLLIFVINLIVGNTFLVTLSRSFIYGLLVVGIIYGITFVFKNYLGIDLEFNEVNAKDSEPNVDIVVGNEDNEDSEVFENINEEENQLQFSPDANDVDGIESDTNEKNFSEESNYESSETDLEDDSDIGKNGLDLEKIYIDDGPIVDFSENDDSNIDNPDDSISGGDGDSESLDRLSDLSYDREREKNEEYSTEAESSEVSSETLKKRIGVDVSFEDVAKAIRTKLKSDE